ncbi:hypothetical protein PS15m_008812 [Mucor circinelloides]
MVQGSLVVACGFGFGFGFGFGSGSGSGGVGIGIGAGTEALIVVQQPGRLGKRSCFSEYSNIQYVAHSKQIENKTCFISMFERRERCQHHVSFTSYTYTHTPISYSNFDGIYYREKEKKGKDASFQTQRL